MERLCLSLLVLALFCGEAVVGFRPARSFGVAPSRAFGPSARSSSLVSFGKPKLSDMLDELDDEGDAASPSASSKAAEEKVVLEPEVVFYEGPPAKAEVVGPALSIFTVIGVIPFAASVARQAWVRYTITSRRVRVASGYQGKDETEIVYSDVSRMLFAWRSFGACGDVVLELRDGARVEMRSVPDFEKVYTEMFSRIPADAQEESDKMTPKADA